MKKAMVFTYEEFEKLVWEVTYDTMGIAYDMYDGWFWTMRNFDTDEEYNEWLEEYGEEAEAESDDRYDDDEGFVYRMIGKKFNAVVDTVIVDVKGNAVAVIFE